MQAENLSTVKLGDDLPDCLTSLFDLPPDRPQEELASYIDGCIHGRDMERQLLSRELHDSTGQLLVALKLGLAHLKVLAGPGATGEAFAEIESVVREVEGHIRAFTFMSYPAALREDGLSQALRRLAQGFADKTGLEITFENGDTIPLNRSSDLTLLRVAQEALTNVYRHAQATSVRVSLKSRPGRTDLSIEDDGRGLPWDEPCSGIGIEGMRQRLEVEGGTLEFIRLKRGTRLVASVPADRFAASSPLTKRGKVQ